MKTSLLFDIDGTLTVPRRELESPMAEALKGLNVPFHVAAGSNLDLVEPQFLKPLWDFGCRKSFDAFVNNGSAHYNCPFADQYSLDFVGEFNFEEHLGPDFDLLVLELETVLKKDEYRLGEGVRVIGEQIKSRGSMLNFTPIGRPADPRLGEEALANRKAFAEFDKATGFRRKVLGYLNERLARVMAEKDLRIMLGGETSFDIVIDGQDKTYPVRWLLEKGFEKIVFIGDALFPGGNDSVIMGFIERWDQPTPCPLEAIKVDGPEDTLRHFRERGWLVD